MSNDTQITRLSNFHQHFPKTAISRNFYKIRDEKCSYTIRMFPPAIDIIPTLLAVVYSNGKYTN